MMYWTRKRAGREKTPTERTQAKSVSKQPTNFLDLPPELREMVYEYLCVDKTMPEEYERQFEFSYPHFLCELPLVCRLINSDINNFLQCQEKVPIKLTNYVDCNHLKCKNPLRKCLHCPVVGTVHIQLIRLWIAITGSDIARLVVIYSHLMRMETSSVRHLTIEIPCRTMRPDFDPYLGEMNATIDNSTLRLQSIQGSLAGRSRADIEQALANYRSALVLPSDKPRSNEKEYIQPDLGIIDRC